MRPRTRLPESIAHDCVIVTIGGLAERAMRRAIRFGDLGIAALDLHARRCWLAIDTMMVPDIGVDVDPFTIIKRVQTADAAGRERARSYFENVICRCHVELEAMGLIPPILTQANRGDPLLSDLQNPEASKNPWKGLLFLLGSLPLVLQALREIRSAMTAPNRTIVIVFSPNSGTAAGGWLVLLALVMSVFPGTSPILLPIMPSAVHGRRESNERTYAIFGANARLLEWVVHHGLTVSWSIPVLGGTPIEIRLYRRLPLYTQLVSTRRRAGGADLKTPDELVAVLGRMLALVIAGQYRGAGPMSLDSIILNTTTDALLEESADTRRGELLDPIVSRDGSQFHWPSVDPDDYLFPGRIVDHTLPLQPTRRFAARGFMAVTLEAKLATEITLSLMRREAARSLLGSRQELRPPPEMGGRKDGDFPSGGESGQPPHHVTLRRHFARRVRNFVVEWWRQIGPLAWERRSFDNDSLDEVVSRVVNRVADSLDDLLDNWRDERTLESELWAVLKELPPHALTTIPSTLDALALDERLVVEALPENELPTEEADNAEGDPAERLDALDDRYRALAANARIAWARLQEPTPPGRREELAARVLEATLKATIIDRIRAGLLPLLDKVRQEYVERMTRLVARVEAALDADERAFAEHEAVLRSQRYLRRDQYELAYPLAAEKLTRHAVMADRIAAGWLRSLPEAPDRAVPDPSAVRGGLAAAIGRLEGITDFPATAAGVLRRLVDDPALLRLVVDRARALVAVSDGRYETHWGIWVSGEESPELVAALLDVQESLRSVLAGEEFGITVNAGPLTLENPADVLVVFAEQVVDFPLKASVSDQPLSVYLEADERLAAEGLAVHRLHDALLGHRPQVEPGRWSPQSNGSRHPAPHRHPHANGRGAP